MDAPLVWTPDARVHVAAARHAFRTEVLTLEMPAGSTLAAMAEAAGVPAWAPARAWIDDWPIAREHWTRVRPRAGRRVTFRVVPAGGGGGDSNKTLRMVLLIVVVVIAIAITIATYGAGSAVWYAVPGLLTGAQVGMIAAAAVAIGGALAINMLLPPPKPKLSAMSQPFFGQPSPTYALTGTRNQLAPYQPVPRVYGRHRLFPPLASFPITGNTAGTEQRLEQTFTLGYGPLVVEELKIGDTALAAYEGVDLQVREGWPDDAPLDNVATVRFEEPLAIELANEVPQVRATRPDTDWLSIDITFPGGLYYVPDWDPQHWHPLTVEFDAYVRALNLDGTPVGTGAWTFARHWSYTEGRRETLRFTEDIDVERGYWEVQVVKHGPTPVPENWSSGAAWTAIRSMRAQDPMPVPGMAKVGLVIQASGQLTGVVDQFNCVATSYLREWNGTAWVVVPSRNPAAIFLDILTGSANARPVPDAEIDYPTLLDWMAECRTRGYTFDAVFDTQTTVFEALQSVAAIGRASFTMRDGKYSVTRDRAQTVPVQFFTPRNSWGFNGSKTFPDIPHALKVKFVNPEAGWQQDERYVYDDGYDALTATKFEGLELFGVTTPDLAWKHGRYWLAAARLRPESWELNVDVEYLVANRGDLVHVNHDVPLWGLTAARIVDLTADGAGVVVTVDEMLDQLADGTLLALRVRQQDGTSYVGPVTLTTDTAARVSRLHSTAPIPEAHVGDLVMLGYWGEETVACVVKAIEPGENLSAKLTLISAAPAILDADTGPIPPFETHITRPPALNRPPPPAPLVLTVRSDETVATVNEPRLVVAFTVPSEPGRVPATAVQAEYRLTDSQASWLPLPTITLPGDQLVVSPVIQGQRYDVRLRSLNVGLSRVSEWVTIVAHRVVGFSTPPPDAVALTLDWGLVELRWLYPTPPIDFAGFEVRYAQGVTQRWEDTVPLHDALVSDTRFHLPPISGRFTFAVKAVDVPGNRSVNAAILVADLEGPRANLLDEVDYGAQGFPGTLEQLVRDLSPPMLCPLPTSDPLMWSPPPTGGDVKFWTADAVAFWGGTYGPGQYSVTLDVPPEDAGATLTWQWHATGPGWTLEYQSGGESPYWTADTDPVWTTDADRAWRELVAWQPWPGAITTSQQQYAFRWTYLGGPGACLDQAVAGFDVPDIDEFFDNLAVPVGGRRLPIAETYRVIRTVLMTVENAALVRAVAPVLVPETVDKDPVLGPLVILRNAQNANSEAGIIDAHVRGY